jgi:hypothetical protein
MQFEGEVQTCTHPYHLRPTPQNTAAYIERVMTATEKKSWAMTSNTLGLNSIGLASSAQTAPASAPALRRRRLLSWLALNN